MTLICDGLRPPLTGHDDRRDPAARRAGPQSECFPLAWSPVGQPSAEGHGENESPGEVILEAEATEEEVAGVEAELREVGLDWPVSAALERRGLGDYPWVIMLAGTPTVIFGVFAKKFTELAAEDAYKGVKSWVQRLASRRRDPNGTITINDPASGTVIVLDPELPDEAYRQLQNVDPARDGGDLGFLSWSQKDQRWVPPE